MKKSILLLAFLGLFGFAQATEFCEIGVCLDLTKGFKTALRADDGQTINHIVAWKGANSMNVYKDWNKDLSEKEKLQFLSDKVAKDIKDYARNAGVAYTLNLSEGTEQLGGKNVPCLTARVSMGFNVSIRKYFLVSNNGVSYMIEMIGLGGEKGFEKNYRTTIDSFHFQD